MKNSRVLLMVSVVLGVLSLWPMVVMGGPKLHKVGGSKGWKENVNYTTWSSQEHVYVGDWLKFVFDKRYYNVLEVNKTGYDYCIDMTFIRNLTRGGRDVVQLTEAKTYYFITGGGYCFHGMKVAVDVQEHPTPAPSPSLSDTAKSGGDSILPSMYTCFGIIVANVVYVSLVLVGIL
ncbi:putative cupredoxin [Medicago truncatula]|uniref:Plastocyanin-like domain protein n=1 Tax=Medicago truncatula TaxID=3880 RepID=G7KLC9_MEDTR|nr:lamin-like protein [Medicago truncatula]AES74792.2 plastocyanin-like domain protein [Medicago truncatula]RHN50103.1 putative cupredoxin [Medicago truncatula]